MTLPIPPDSPLAPLAEECGHKQCPGDCARWVGHPHCMSGPFTSKDRPGDHFIDCDGLIPSTEDQERIVAELADSQEGAQDAMNLSIPPAEPFAVLAKPCGHPESKPPDFALPPACRRPDCTGLVLSTQDQQRHMDEFERLKAADAAAREPVVEHFLEAVDDLRTRITELETEREALMQVVEAAKVLRAFWEGSHVGLYPDERLAKREKVHQRLRAALSSLPERKDDDEHRSR